jgi:hypothetical protein
MSKAGYSWMCKSGKKEGKAVALFYKEWSAVNF